jgi:hypothetical protein
VSPPLQVCVVGTMLEREVEIIVASSDENSM